MRGRHEKLDFRERLGLTVEEAGRLLGLGRSASYEAARRGQIPTVRFGNKKMVVPRPALERMLAEAGQSQAQNK